MLLKLTVELLFKKLLLKLLIVLLLLAVKLDCVFVFELGEVCKKPAVEKALIVDPDDSEGFIELVDAFVCWPGFWVDDEKWLVDVIAELVEVEMVVNCMNGEIGTNKFEVLDVSPCGEIPVA